MKVTQIITLFGLSSFAVAECDIYKLYGSIVKDPIMGWSWSGHLDDGLGIYPNKVLCGQGAGDNKGHRDDDGTWHLPCQEGFSLTLTGNGAHAIMVNGALTDEWDTGATADQYDCYGACQDKGGVCLQCTQYDFTSNYEC
ncbi:hypothetical protein F4777DRAFT_514194 [Nemania sp. FL0916]|nr:hypothetical protein F4777DRAFT_514194 [Nemania sp. FL0916]